MTGSTHRAKPRYGRLAAAGSALVVTLVALLGAMGVLPAGARAAAAAENKSAGQVATLSGLKIPDATSRQVTPPVTQQTDSEPSTTALPADTGEGKRVVFDMSDQRVWLVEDGDEVVRTYLVSGSLTDNLDPSTYSVYSKSRWAVGIGDTGVMQYFTRFTHGDNAAIGFHSIPTKHGKALQTHAQLGTPRSHGCIRQALPDAKKLWDFAPVGTKVVVTA
ncbi:MAG: L,D-transpeptidase [Marmoricola sp.]